MRIVYMTILVFDGPVPQFRLLASFWMINFFTDSFFYNVINILVLFCVWLHFVRKQKYKKTVTQLDGIKVFWSRECSAAGPQKPNISLYLVQKKRCTSSKYQYFIVFVVKEQMRSYNFVWLVAKDKNTIQKHQYFIIFVAKQHVLNIRIIDISLYLLQTMGCKMCFFMFFHVFLCKS